MQVEYHSSIMKTFIMKVTTDYYRPNIFQTHSTTHFVD